MRGRARLAALLLAAVGLLARPAGAADELEIGRIEVTGVTVFVQPAIEEALEVAPGDRLERIKVVRTAENLQELYKSRGYERVGIKSRIVRRKGDDGQLESVLEFAIVENLPTRVASVRFRPDALDDESFRKYWARLESELVARVGLKSGDLYDQEKIAAGRRAVQDTLASEEFIGARVDDVRANEVAAPAGAALQPGGVPSAARWVELVFHVDLGDRVSFGFRGNTAFTQARLNALVEEQRLLGIGKDYVGAIRSRIEAEYRAEGYARVSITAYTSERRERQERHVTYDIHEGQRMPIDSIEFDGNAVYTDAQLLEQFMSRASPLLQHGYYVEKDVQKAAELLLEWIKSKGYLAAKLVTITTVPGNRPKRAGRKQESLRLVIYLYEGDQTIVRSAEFSGLQAFEPEEVRRFLGLRESEPLDLFAFSEGLERLKAAYRAKGYLGVRIVNEGTDTVVRYSDDNRAAEVHLDISEGPQYRVSAVRIEGLARTKESVVTRELAIQEGEVLSETDLAETEARLRRLGIFSLVTIRLQDDPARSDGKVVRISLQEGTPGVVAGGPGFRNDFGVRLFGQLAYTNLWGLNHTLAFTANANRRIENFHFVEYQGQLSYLYPWFLVDELTFRPAFTVSGTQYIKFDATTISAAVTWEKRLLRAPSLTALFTYNLERVEQFNSVTEEDNQKLLIGSIIPSLRLDTRDNVLSPTTGWYLTASMELAAPWLFSQTDPFPVGYSRFQGRIDRLIPITRSITWYLSYRGGFERSSEPKVADPADPAGERMLKGSGAIPLIKHFALGGAGSLRGFREQQLNHYGTDLTGSLSYSNYRTQVDFPFVGALRFGPFVDAANLLVDNHSVGQFLFESLRYSVGFGFHYQTPVGPVNLDIGFNPDPRPADPPEDRARIHFSIGVI